jgi:hypothetical protein
MDVQVLYYRSALFSGLQNKGEGGLGELITCLTALFKNVDEHLLWLT